jgi:hypothetical protein
MEHIANVDVAVGEPGLAACSLENHRAVVVEAVHEHDQSLHTSPVDVIARVQVIDLATGSQTLDRRYPIGDPRTEVRVAASLDGRTLAEVRAAGTTVISLVDAHVIATLPGWRAVGFSSDGARVGLLRQIVDDAATSGRRPWEIRVADVATESTIWSSTGAFVLQNVVAEPGTQRMLLAGTTGGLDDLIVIDPQGRGHAIAQEVSYLSACPCPGRSAE